MSSVFFSFLPFDKVELQDIADELSFVERSWTRISQDEKSSVVLSRFDQEFLWAPATDPDLKTIAILVGRIALADQQWKWTRELPYKGGLACRHILDAWQRLGYDLTSELNGAFGIVLYEPPKQRLTVVTDRGGFFPLYMTGSKNNFTLCSHSNVLAKHNSARSEYDFVSMAEMLSRRTEHPFTYYTGITQLDPGSIYTFSASCDSDRTRYWNPLVRRDSTPSVSELSEELVDTLKSAAQKRSSDILGSTGLFLSAGADSRGVLYATQYPQKVTCFTFYDEPNAELKTAKRIAEGTGSHHIALQRDFEHYAQAARETARITEGMGRIFDAHYTSFLHTLWESGIQNFISGDYVDSLFKDGFIASKYKKLFGRNLPVKKLTNSSLERRWNRINDSIGKKWHDQISQRMDERFQELNLLDTSEENIVQVGLKRAIPFSRVVSGSILVLLRTLPWDPVLADTELLNLSLRIPADMRLSSQVWEKSVTLLRPDLKGIRNNNNLSKLGVTETQKILSFSWGVLYRKMRRRDVGGTTLTGFTNRGSWPNFSFLVGHSAVIPVLWKRTPVSGEVLSDLLEFDPWSLSIEDWILKDMLLFLRLLSLKVWLDQQ